jgi:ribosome maturation factor RimP
MLSKQQIDNILESTIQGLGLEYICSELASVGSGKKSSAVIRIFIDKSPSGVTLSDCEEVSRQVSRVLDVETSAAQNASSVNTVNTNSITSRYSLEVSSPGIDRPLVKLEHFKRFVGKKAKIKLSIGINSNNVIQRNIVGYIKDVTNDQVVIESLDSKELVYSIELSNIYKANLVPEW